MVDVVIDVRGLVKTFGAHRALDGLDLEVRAGEVHGFLGPNGAGKSTTHPRAARAAARRRRHGDRVRRWTRGATAWPSTAGSPTCPATSRCGQPVRRRDDRHAAADARRRAGASRRAELLERFDLDPTKKGRAYSKGNRQKVALVAAFAADVDLLVLDEPTSGLDPLMEQVFDECVAERVAAGTTVLLSSHILSEVERLADRVTIIREGRAVETGTLDELRHLRRSRIRADRARRPPDLAGLPGVHDLTRRRLDASPARSIPMRCLGAAALTAAGVTALTSAPPTLEELFLDAYRPPRRRHERALRRHLARSPATRCAATGCWSRSGSPCWCWSSTPRRPPPGSLYATTAERVTAARAINASPAMVALYGPILDVSSLGELAMTKVTVLYAVILALMFLVVVRRHTRTDEESGHAELLAGTAIGRDALLARRWSRACCSPSVSAVLAAARRHRRRAARSPGPSASARPGLGTGLVAAASTAVACQLSASSRTCFGIAGAALAVALPAACGRRRRCRWLSWLTPFGWNTRLRAWSEPRWWVLLLYVGLAAALVGRRPALRARRDLGSGLLPARPGRRMGSPRLADALALAWRVHNPPCWAGRWACSPSVA